MLKKEQVKIIFFDIDNTIVTHNGDIPESTKEAIFSLNENGYIVALATGRDYSSTTVFLNELDIANCVSFDGRCVKVNDEVIFKKCFDSIRFNELLSHLELFSCPMAFFNHDSIKTSFSEHPVIKTFGFSSNVTPYNKVVFEYDEYYKNIHEPIRIVIFTEILIEDRLSLLFPELLFRRLNKELVEISVKGYTKAYGIKKVLDFLNLNRNHGLAFGDGNNDGEMFEFLNQSVAMGNSVDSLKEKSTFITKNIEDNGIYFALKKFGFI